MSSIKIGLPVAQYHPGNPSDYLAAAFAQLGHSAEILNLAQFQAAFAAGRFDLYLCVDSGAGLDLAALRPGPKTFANLAFWYIDFRHNKDRAARNPADFQNCRLIDQSGGWIFQAQYEDFEECRRRELSRCSFLPLAADPAVWCDQPAAQKMFDLGFVGNIWDQARLSALQALQGAGFRLGFAGPGRAWKERAGELLRCCKIGFNINSFFGTPVCFDVNMRVFETLSCGVPLVTNWVPGLERILPSDLRCVKTYRRGDEIVPLIRTALSDPAFLDSGSEGRSWVADHATYRHRAEEVLQVISRNSALPGAAPAV